VVILADGPGKYYDLDHGIYSENIPLLAEKSFSRPPPPIMRTMSIYRSLARRVMQSQADDAAIIVLLCPRVEWDQLGIAGLKISETTPSQQQPPQELPGSL